MISVLDPCNVFPDNTGLLGFRNKLLLLLEPSAVFLFHFLSHLTGTRFSTLENKIVPLRSIKICWFTIYWHLIVCVWVDTVIVYAGIDKE